MSNESLDQYEKFLYEAYLRGLEQLSDDSLIDIGKRARAILKRRIKGSIIDSRAKLAACETEWKRRRPKTDSNSAE